MFPWTCSRCLSSGVGPELSSTPQGDPSDAAQQMVRPTLGDRSSLHSCGLGSAFHLQARQGRGAQGSSTARLGRPPLEPEPLVLVPGASCTGTDRQAGERRAQGLDNRGRTAHLPVSLAS